MLFTCVALTHAQRTITGMVSDASGESLIGANVISKGSTTGTVTEIDGSFSLEVPDGATILVISYTGYQTQEVDILGLSEVNVILAEGRLLDEVVVTALGIEKESKTLGYGIDQIDADELTKARSANIVNALQGKVTGVNIGSSDGNLGASSKIIIRGATSLSGNNDPLWIVDGVPINNDQITSNGTRISGNRDFGNGASVINPDDVETMSVLKGAAATALYGSRAAAGAIVVTTKSGKSNPDGTTSIEFSTSYRTDDLFVTPKYQQQYGMGDFAKYDSSSVGFDWGPTITGQEVTLPITGERGPLTAYDNNGINDFFQTGTTLINNLSISEGGEKFRYRLGLGTLNQTGILPGASLDRYNASLNAGVKHSEKFETTIGVQFIKTDSEGTGATGANDPNIIGMSAFSSTMNPADFDPWIDEFGNQLNFAGPTSNNYLWIRNENINQRNDTRVIANMGMSYKILSNLKLSAKYGYDYGQDNRFFSNRVGTIQALEGDYRIDQINNIQRNLDILVNYYTDLSDKIKFNVIAGYNDNYRKREDEGYFGEELTVPNLFAPGATASNVPARFFNERRLFGAYASADFTYDDWATLTLTGRNDWSSTLPLANNSYFYPSVSVAAVLTDALDIKSDFLNYFKLRASFAQVGNDTDPYQLTNAFIPAARATGQYSLNVNFPFNGQLAFTADPTIGSPDLLPEEQTSYEIGAEMDFLDYRVGLDVTYFSTENRNQILALPIPESSGSSFVIQNVGQVNTSGIEIALDATPIRMKNFSWTTAVNFSTAKVEVVELADDLDRILLASAFSSTQVVGEVGGGFELFAIPYLRDSATNRPIINPNTGTRQAGEIQAMGSVLPDFNMGFINDFTVGPVNVSFTVDWRSGGVMKSSTVDGLQTGGLTEETLLNRGGTFIDTEGVLLQDDGTVIDNNIPLASAADFWQSLDDNSLSEPFIFDASFVKLREVAINYDLPSSFLGDSFIKGLTIGIEGRNLALLHSKVPHIDPEANLFGAGADGFGVERASVPSTRSIGFNLRARF